MSLILDWPCCDLPVTAWQQPRLQPVQVTGPESIGGIRQDVAIPSWRWSAGVTVTTTRGEHGRTLLGFLARLDGTRNTIRLPICGAGLTLREPGAALYSRGVPWNGDGGLRLFAEGMGFAYPGRGYEMVLGSSPKGATSVSVPWAGLWPLIRIGHHITIGEDLHIVTGATQGAGETVLEIKPPLRRAHAAGTVFYTHATGLFRLASADVPVLAQSLGRFGTLEIGLIEAWERV